MRFVYKLVADGITRRLSFDSQPTWNALASRVKEFYSIPLNDVGLIYVDDDGDEITISSQYELEDYHDSLTGNSVPLTKKFFVRNLAISGARRPPSDSSGSGFSYVKYSPVQQDPPHPSPPRSVSPPKRGRSPSPVVLSASRAIANEEEPDAGAAAEQLRSFFQGLVVRSPEVRPRQGSLSRERSRSLSPSFMKMARSPQSNVGILSRSSSPPPVEYLPGSHGPSRPPSSLAPRSVRSYRAASPPIIMGGIRGPSPTNGPMSDFIAAEDLVNFVSIISRPPSSLSRRSLTSQPGSAVMSDHRPKRPKSLSSAERCDSTYMARSRRSRSRSLIYTNRSRSLSPAEPHGGVPMHSLHSPARIFVRPYSPRSIRVQSVISVSARSRSRSSRQSSVIVVRPTCEGRSGSRSPSPPERFAPTPPVDFSRSYNNSPRVSREILDPVLPAVYSGIPVDNGELMVSRRTSVVSQQSDRYASFPHSGIPSSRGSSRPPYALERQSRTPSVDEGKEPSPRWMTLSEMQNLQRRRSPSFPSVPPDSPCYNPVEASMIATQAEPILDKSPASSRASSRASSLAQEDVLSLLRQQQQRQAAAPTCDNLVKTTLEQLRHVSQGVMASLRQEMETLRAETMESVRLRVEEMSEGVVNGAHDTLSHVRTEMDIVKVEARELLDLKMKISADVAELESEVDALRSEVASTRAQYKQVEEELGREREGVERDIKKLRDALERLRAEREVKKQEMEEEKEKERGGEEEEEVRMQSLARESGYNPCYVPVPSVSVSSPPPLWSNPPPSRGQQLSDVNVNLSRRRTWAAPNLFGTIIPPPPGFFPRQPVVHPPPAPPSPPPPPPPPPPPASLRPREAYPAVLLTDVQGPNLNERNRPRHLPRPPTSEDRDEWDSHARAAGLLVDSDGPVHGARNSVHGHPPSRTVPVVGQHGLRRTISVPTRLHHHHPNHHPHHPHHPHPRHPHHPHHPHFRPHRRASRFANGGLRFSSASLDDAIPENDVVQPASAFVGAESESDWAVPQSWNVGAGMGDTGAQSDTDNDNNLSTKPSSETLGGAGAVGNGNGNARIERAEVEEARKVYKMKKAAWKAQRDEARKTFMNQTQNGSTTNAGPGPVRPFDNMVIPVEFSGANANVNANGPSVSMPGALPPTWQSYRPTPPPPPPPPSLPAAQERESPETRVASNNAGGGSSRPWSVRFTSPHPPLHQTYGEQSETLLPRQPARPSLVPLQPTQVFPVGFQPIGGLTFHERQLKSSILTKLRNMGFGSDSMHLETVVEREVRDELNRVNGRPHSVDSVSMMERLVERLLTNPQVASNAGSTNAAHKNARERSISPASRRLIDRLIEEEAASVVGAGPPRYAVSGANTTSGSGSIPGQWNGREF